MENQGFIPLMVPDIREEDIQAVAEVLRSGMLVQGTKTEQLEATIAGYTGVRHAIAVSNGTASLFLTLHALGIGPGDEVIVPAFSFMATANVVELTGARAVFIDIEQDTFNMNPALLEKAITPRTKAIMPVHEFGLACEITEICTIAARHGIPVIEDAACALGATENGKYTGSFGLAGSFSFHPRKAITSGEGGMITTNDDALAAKLRSLRNHGMAHKNGRTEYVLAGYNQRMTDFQAALLLSQFERFDAILAHRQVLAAEYLRTLAGNPKLRLPATPANKYHTWQSFHILLDETIQRDELIVRLKEKGIGTNLGAQCMPAQEYFQNTYHEDVREKYPNAMRAYEQGLVLPLYHGVSESTGRYISSTLGDVIL